MAGVNKFGGGILPGELFFVGIFLEGAYAQRVYFLTIYQTFYTPKNVFPFTCIYISLQLKLLFVFNI